MTVVVDAGGLIGFDRHERRAVGVITRCIERGDTLVVPAPVIAQTWRDGRRQARLARLLSSPQVSVEPLDDRRAREAGQLCGVSGTADIADAAVVVAARRHRAKVLTSDSADITRLDPSLACVPC